MKPNHLRHLYFPSSAHSTSAPHCCRQPLHWVSALTLGSQSDPLKVYWSWYSAQPFSVLPSHRGWSKALALVYKAVQSAVWLPHLPFSPPSLHRKLQRGYDWAVHWRNTSGSGMCRQMSISLGIERKTECTVILSPLLWQVDEWWSDVADAWWTSADLCCWCPFQGQFCKKLQGALTCLQFLS